MPIEQVRDVTTPTEMRAEIDRLGMHDALVNQVMRLADCQGITESDSYVVLAYHSLKAKSSLQARLLNELNSLPPQQVVLHDADGVRWCANPK